MNDGINPYTPPASSIPPSEENPLSTWNILAKSWRIFTAHFLAISVVVMTVWIPCDLLSSYMDNFVFGEEDVMQSFKLIQFLENFFGIIATAGVISLILRRLSGEAAGPGSALAQGLACWPRMWWTRFLSGVILILAFLLLIVPFFMLYPCILMAECSVVAEGRSGMAAVRRSIELTRGRYWLLFRLAVLPLLAIVVISMALFTLPEVFPQMDHWLVEAALSVLCSICAAFDTVVIYCAYQACLTATTKNTTA